MLRAGMLSRAGVALLGLWLCRATVGGAEPAGERDVDLQVVVLSASGRAQKPEFDPRAPVEIRKQIERMNLAYGRYDFVGIQRQGAKFGTEVTFDLPDKEALAIKPAADAERPDRLRLGCRVLDEERKPILISPMRVSYDKTFFLQRLKGGTGVLMGVSARKPGAPPAKP